MTKTTLERCGECPACHEVRQVRRAYEAGSVTWDRYKEACCDNPCSGSVVTKPNSVNPVGGKKISESFPRPRGVMDAVTDGVLADLDCSLRDCWVCGSEFTGPGLWCPVCTAERDCPISQTAARALLEACEAAVEALEPDASWSPSLATIAYRKAHDAIAQTKGGT